MAQSPAAIPTAQSLSTTMRIPVDEIFDDIIEDLNSTNGTYVNGVRVNRCILRHNDLIRIGDATILFSQQKHWDHT